MNAPDREDELERAIADLREAAARLRAGEAEGEQAAALVERCAELAAEVGAQLDRRARTIAEEPPPGQETLL